jgi:transcriptional regulator with XRE-family HTH domain
MTKWDLLIAARERMHLSQGEAAERVNVGLVTYQRWEAGKAKPQPQHMRHLYAVFGSLLDPSETRGSSDEALSQRSVGQTALPASVIGNGSEQMPIVERDEEVDEVQAFIATHLLTSLLSLTFMEPATINAMLSDTLFRILMP